MPRIGKAVGNCVVWGAVLMLSGCELMANGIPTGPDLIAKNQLVGANINEAYTKLGRPTSVSKLPSGLSLAKWDDAYSNTTTTGISELSAGPGGSTMVTPTTSTSTSNHECILELTFNNQNIVTDFNTWKSDRLACNRLYSGRR